MIKYRCTVCGYIYDPEVGGTPKIKPGTAFEDLPDDCMIFCGYFYTCLDRITEKCRNFEEDMRRRIAEKAVEDRNMMI